MQLVSAGAKIDVVSFRFSHSLQEFADVWCQSISIDTSLELAEWKKDGKDLFEDYSNELSEEFIHWNKKAYKSDIRFFQKLNEVRTDVLDAHERVFQNYDLIISPVTAVESKYKCNTLFGDVITIEVGVEEFKGIRIKLFYVMKKGDVVVNEATSEHCFLDGDGKVLNIKKAKPELYETLSALVMSE